MNRGVQTARAQILHILTDLDTDPSFADYRLRRALAEHDYERRERAFITRMVYGVLGKRLYLDYVISRYSKTPLAKMKAPIRNILRMGAYQLLFMDKVPDSAACNESVKLAKGYKRGAFAGFVNGVLRSIARGKEEISLPQKSDGVSYLSVKYSVSADIVRLWIEAYGYDFCQQLLAAFDQPEDILIRVNTLKTDSDALAARLEAEGVQTSPAKFVPHALTVRAGGDLSELTSFQQGLFHVQDTSSQLCARLLGAKPGELVLDVCSAPGGKGFTIAEEMEGKGRLIASDLYAPRCEQIRLGAERLGIKIIQVQTHDATQPLPGYQGKADRVLCDVPCSGLGILRKKPDIRLKQFDDFSELVRIQRQILAAAADCLKPGGRLVYSTCTINPAENEENVAWFLASHPHFRAEKAELDPCIAQRELAGLGTLLLPQSTQMDGFFFCAFTKNEEDVTIS